MINARTDFPKRKSTLLPMITIKIENRTLAIAIHVFLQNLKERRTTEDKYFRNSHQRKLLPNDVYLNSVQLSFDVY